MNPEPPTPEVGIASILTGAVVFLGLGIFLVQIIGPILGAISLVLLAVGESRGWFDD